MTDPQYKKVTIIIEDGSEINTIIIPKVRNVVFGNQDVLNRQYDSSRVAFLPSRESKINLELDAEYDNDSGFIYALMRETNGASNSWADKTPEEIMKAIQNARDKAKELYNGRS